MASLLSILGGLGLFLLGMSVMSDGLKDLAGDAIRRCIARFTRNPATGAITGATSTAIIQSSSATTLMAVGFVSAGLMTFPQSLGIIFGANIGTTVTGWLVAFLGFRLSLQELVLPLILMGALLRLLGRRKIAAVGYALAGFGLIFTGIAMLQVGMETYKDVVTPESFPPDTISGRLILVFIGIAITLVTQSSSAGVATAITAVHVGNITLAQGAAMVIGMDVGTTVTAAIATIGASTDAKRTGLAHVIYNIMTGCGAFVLLPFFIVGWNTLASPTLRADPEFALVGFHTLFNTLGVLLVLPFTNNFAALIMRVVPSSKADLTGQLDNSFLDEPALALAAVQAVLIEATELVFASLAHGLQGDSSWRPSPQLDRLKQCLTKVRRYLGNVSTTVRDGQTYRDHVRLLHVADHLARLIVRTQREDRMRTVRSDGELRLMGTRFAGIIHSNLRETGQLRTISGELQQLWQKLDGRIESFRRETIERSTTSEHDTTETIARLDAIRWLRRVCYHAWRSSVHLRGDMTDSAGGLEPEPENLD